MAFSFCGTLIILLFWSGEFVKLAPVSDGKNNKTDIDYEN